MAKLLDLENQRIDITKEMEVKLKKYEELNAEIEKETIAENKQKLISARNDFKRDLDTLTDRSVNVTTQIKALSAIDGLRSNDRPEVNIQGHPDYSRKDTGNRALGDWVQNGSRGVSKEGWATIENNAFNREDTDAPLRGEILVNRIDIGNRDLPMTTVNPNQSPIIQPSVTMPLTPVPVFPTVFLPLVSRQVTLNTGTVDFPMFVENFGGMGPVSGVTATAEGTAKPSGEITVIKARVTLNEIARFTTASRTLIRRSNNSGFEAQLMATLSNLLDRACEYQMLCGGGDSVNQAQGVITATGTGAVARETAGTVTINDMINLRFGTNAPKAYFHDGGAYFMSQSAFGALCAIKETEDSNLPAMGINWSTPSFPTFMGCPIYRSGFLPDVGTTGDVFFGNPAYYAACFDQQVGVRREEGGKELGINNQYLFIAETIFGGTPLIPSAFGVLQGTAFAPPAA